MSSGTALFQDPLVRRGSGLTRFSRISLVRCGSRRSRPGNNGWPFVFNSVHLCLVRPRRTSASSRNRGSVWRDHIDVPGQGSTGGEPAVPEPGGDSANSRESRNLVSRQRRQSSLREGVYGRFWAGSKVFIIRVPRPQRYGPRSARCSQTPTRGAESMVLTACSGLSLRLCPCWPVDAPCSRRTRWGRVSLPRHYIRRWRPGY